MDNHSIRSIIISAQLVRADGKSMLVTIPAVAMATGQFSLDEAQAVAAQMVSQAVVAVFSGGISPPISDLSDDLSPEEIDAAFSDFPGNAEEQKKKDSDELYRRLAKRFTNRFYDGTSDNNTLN